MDIGFILVELMRRLNLTQTELAEKTGLSQSYISHLCTNKKTPSLETLERITSSLGISMVAFFMIDTPSIEEGFYGDKLDSREENLLSVYRSFDDRDKTIVDSLVSTMRETHKQQYSEKQTSSTSSNGKQKSDEKNKSTA